MKYHAPSTYWQSDEAVTVDNINLGPTGHTRPDVFHLYLDEVSKAKTANQLHSLLGLAHRNLMKLGIFHSLQFTVDTSMGPGHCNIGVVADEAPRKGYGISLGGGEDKVVVSGTLDVINVFGRAETWKSSVSYAAPGGPDYQAFDFAFEKPLLFRRPGAPEQRWGVAGHLHHADRAAEARHAESAASLAAELAYGGAAWNARAGASRLAAGPGASAANLAQGGWRPRAALGLALLRDSRDEPRAPVRGRRLRAALELAAGPSGPLFARAELAALAALPLAPGAAILLRARLGHIHPFSTPRHEPAVTSVDAFQLGGADLVPGFWSRGIGRTSVNESLGFLSYWLLSAHCVAGIPGVPEFLKVQAHATACGLSGVIGGTAEQQDLAHAFSSDSLRASVGVGLIAALPVGRITLTLSRVLMKQAYDSCTGVVQVGFSSSFD